MADELDVPSLPTQQGGTLPEVDPPPLPRSGNADRYHYGGEIARGGMGRVVDATDTVLGRVVALKEALALDHDSLTRFAREVRITARLEHPSIVAVHDVGTAASGAPFYVMRKIGGQPLERLVVQRKALDDRLALLPHIVATAHAVAHAHERGIIHRDIKPPNILCGELGETIVIDWGLAKIVGEADEPTSPAAVSNANPLVTQAGVVFGTPGFMAPEQLRGVIVDPRCDVYAIGATLYHLLARKPPHYAKSSDEMMKAAVAGPPIPITVAAPGVPRELATIVDKALAHDATQRYQNARELADDLHRFLTGQLVAAHHYTRSERLLRFIARNRIAVATVTVAALALAIGGAIAVTRVVNERDRADREARSARAAEAEATDARRRAEQRADQLMLRRARELATTHPTYALAMLKPLAERYPREVATVATVAHAHGIAWSAIGPRHTIALEVDRSANRALALGDDGSLRIYDLSARTARILAEHSRLIGARFTGGPSIVAWSENSIELLDNSSASASHYAIAAKPRAVAAAGDQIYWIDRPTGRLWQTAVDTEPHQVELRSEPVIVRDPAQLSISLDRRWIALIGATRGMAVIERGSATVFELIDDHVLDVAWSADGRYLALLVERAAPEDRRVVLVALDKEATIVTHELVGAREHIAIVGQPALRMYAVAASGAVGVVARDRLAARRAVVGEPLAIGDGPSGAIIAAGAGGLTVLTDDGDHAIDLPAGVMHRVAIASGSPFVVGAIEGRIVVWRVADTMPREESPATLTEVGERDATVLLASPDREVTLNGEVDDRGLGLVAKLPTAAAVVASGAMCVIDAGDAILVATQGEPRRLGPADRAFAFGDRLVLGDTANGTLWQVNVAAGRRELLVQRPTTLLAVNGSSGWVAAAFGDGTLWRKDLATGGSTTLAINSAPRALAITNDGAVFYPDDRALRRWTAEGARELVVELASRIERVELADHHHVFVITAGGTGYAIERAALTEPGRAANLGPPVQLVGDVQIAPSRGLLVEASRGVLDIVDPVTTLRWTLAGGAGLEFSSPRISREGHFIAAHRRIVDRKREDEARARDVTVVWRLAHPPANDSVERWLDGLTNAVVDPATGELTWR